MHLKLSISHVSEVQTGLPGDQVVRNLPCNAGDTGSILGPGGLHVLPVS